MKLQINPRLRSIRVNFSANWAVNWGSWGDNYLYSPPFTEDELVAFLTVEIKDINQFTGFVPDYCSHCIDFLDVLRLRNQGIDLPELVPVSYNITVSPNDGWVSTKIEQCEIDNPSVKIP